MSDSIPNKLPKYCKTQVVVSAVCFNQDQTIDGVLIPAFHPIIKKVITPYVLTKGICKAQDSKTRYFDFENPNFELVSGPDYNGECDYKVQSLKRCDAVGNEIYVNTIDVNTEFGSPMTATYTDFEGNPVPEPVHPLMICNPTFQTLCGCIVLADGTEIENITLNLQIDEQGISDYGLSYYATSDGNSSLFPEGAEFKKDCNPTTPIEETETKYCYDLSQLEYPCADGTFTVNGEIKTLCDTTSSSFMTEGDICSAGGIRSWSGFDRHPIASNNTGSGFNISSITTDALNVAGQLNSEGCIGGVFQNGNFRSDALLGADVFGLSGTASTITLSGEWFQGSGLGVGVYDCATGQILPLAQGETPSTYDVDNFGVEVYNGGTGSFSGVAGSHTWDVDTSSVADLSTLVFYTVVIHPQADMLCDFAVNGISATGGDTCSIGNQTDLINALSEITGTEWTIEGESICTVSDDVLGDLVCGDLTIEPTITTSTVTKQIPLVSNNAVKQVDTKTQTIDSVKNKESI